jgi:hypothetical protein
MLTTSTHEERNDAEYDRHRSQFMRQTLEAMSLE